MRSYLLAFSLASVPDLESYAAINDLDGKSVEELHDLLGDQVGRPVYHTIVCLGSVLASREEDAGPWTVASLGASSVAQETEEQLVVGLADSVAGLRPQLLTYDGTGFDITVLRYRGIAHHVRAHFLFAPEGSPDAILDIGRLCAVGGGGKVRLGTLCREMGLRRGSDAGGRVGMDQADVEALYRAGRTEEIARQCERDATDTYRLWLRHELSNGRLPEQDFWASEDALRRAVHAVEQTRPALPRVA